MKKFLTLFLFTLIGSLAFAQQVPEKANTIIITLNDSSNVHQKIIKAFSSKDFTVKDTKKITSTVVSDPKTLKNKTRVGLTADIKGADVILTGKILIAGQSNISVEYKSGKSSPHMLAWEEMEKVAKAMGGKIQYEKK